MGDEVVVVVSDVLVDVSGGLVAAGVEVVVVFVVVLLSEELEVAGDGFMTVVLFSVFSGAGDAAGAVVSVFCSQAAKSAALARMQMYFFIIFWIEGPYWAKG